MPRETGRHFVVTALALSMVYGIMIQGGSLVPICWGQQEGTVAPPIILAPAFLAILSRLGLQFDTNDSFSVRVISDFGAMFAVNTPAIPPPRYLFESEVAVADFQQSLNASDDLIATRHVILQKLAEEALLAARADAEKKGLTITPAGDDASRRTYATTVTLRESRVRPAVEHWISAKRLTRSQADRLLALDPAKQVPEVLRLESDGIFFSTQFDKSILYSVAAPGTSQHLSLLALDVQEHAIPEVRNILASHGWFQTVYSDLPHFTYLGRTEAELPRLGLVQKRNAGRVFWVPAAAKTRGAPAGEPDVTETCVF